MFILNAYVQSIVESRMGAAVSWIPQENICNQSLVADVCPVALAVGLPCASWFINNVVFLFLHKLVFLILLLCDFGICVSYCDIYNGNRSELLFRGILIYLKNVCLGSKFLT